MPLILRSGKGSEQFSAAGFMITQLRGNISNWAVKAHRWDNQEALPLDEDASGVNYSLFAQKVGAVLRLRSGRAADLTRRIWTRQPASFLAGWLRV